MPDDRTLLGGLHEATHRVPGVPAHRARKAGHQGTAQHGRAHASPAAHASTAAGDRSAGHTGNHSPTRPPRVVVAGQRRVAALFGQEL